MPFDIASAAGGLASSAAGGILGLALGGINNDMQYNQAARLQGLQIQGQKEMTDYNRQSAFAQWMNTGPQQQVANYQAAGLNPGLMYGQGGGGGQTASVPQGTVSGQQAPNHGEQAAAGMEIGMQMQMQQAQIKVLQTQAAKNQAEAEKTKGIDTDVAGQTFENLRQTYDNTKLDMTLKNIQNYEQQATQGNRLQYIASQTKLAMTQVQIQSNTADAQIQAIQQEAIGAALKNTLTEAQIPNTQADTIVKQEQVKKMAAEILQNWGQLDINQKNQKVQELAQTMSANNPNIMGVLGRELNTAIDNIYHAVGSERKTMTPQTGAKQ